MYWSSQALFDDRSGPVAQHIALVLHDFSSGGTERVAVRLAGAWAAAGRRVTLFCGNAEGPLAAHISPRVIVAPLAPRISRGPASRLHLGRALAGMVRGAGPDVVVGPGNYHIPILATMMRELGRDRPAVACKLSNPLSRADRSRMRQLAFTAGFRRFTREMDALVAMSPVFAAEATLLSGRRDIACVEEPSLDAMPRPPARPRRPTGIVLCIGRLVRQKNFALALDAFARARLPQRLIILGEGEQEAMLRARALALGIADRVTFAGYVRDTAPYLAEADALLCSSIYEGYPAALIEALAAGVPVVSTPCSLALPEILTHDSFGAVTSARAEDLARALDLVLGRQAQPALAPLVELARRHQLDVAAQSWLDLLDRAVAMRERALARA